MWPFPKKLTTPMTRNTPSGEVSLENVVPGDDHGVARSYIAEQTEQIRKKLQRRFERYHRIRGPVALKDKIIIIVDDGIATGNTLKVTAQLVQYQHPQKTVVAVPVAPRGAIQNLQDSQYIDEVIWLLTPHNFQAVGQFYSDFEQLSQEEAIEFME